MAGILLIPLAATRTMKTSLPRPKQPAKTILFAFLALVLLALLLECAVRLPAMQEGLPAYRSFGMYHYQFEIKWFRLKAFTADGVDALVMGSSLVNTGVDPMVLAEAYTARTGEQLRTFNFGVEGITIHANLELTKLLLERYQPKVLIYGTEVRDLDESIAPASEARLLQDPWLRYKMGDFNLHGWLVDHSQLLQVYLPYRNWIRADFPDTFYTLFFRTHSTSSEGYEADLKVMTPDIYPTDERYLNCMDYYPTARISPSRLEELRALVELGQANGVKVVVVKMPVHPLVIACMGGDEQDQAFQTAVAAAVEEAGGVFLLADPGLQIPPEGYADLEHLNLNGAPLFSRSLGERLANLDEVRP